MICQVIIELSPVFSNMNIRLVCKTLKEEKEEMETFFLFIYISNSDILFLTKHDYK